MKIEDILIVIGVLFLLGGCAYNDAQDDSGFLLSEAADWELEVEWVNGSWVGAPEECKPVYDTDKEFLGWICEDNKEYPLVNQEDLDYWAEVRNNASLLSEASAIGFNLTDIHSLQSSTSCWGLVNTSMKFCCDGWVRNANDYKVIHISEAFRQSMSYTNWELHLNGDKWMDRIGETCWSNGQEGCQCYGN